MQHASFHDLWSPQPRLPSSLLRYTCGYEDEDEFLRSGSEIKTMFDLALRNHLGLAFEACRNVLDFGCGCGRVLRHVRAERVFGCDSHAGCVSYCRASFEHASCYRNAERPPLIYRDDAFDLVLAFSVFSRMPLELEEVWLAELTRVGAPSCAYLISVHGDWLIEHLGVERAVADKSGFHFSRGQAGSPHGYSGSSEISYHTSEYISREWSRYFDIVAVIKGDDPGRYLAPDEGFSPIGAVPWFRPMGEDLVVARKRA